MCLIEFWYSCGYGINIIEENLFIESLGHLYFCFVFVLFQHQHVYTILSIMHEIMYIYHIYHIQPIYNRKTSTLRRLWSYYSKSVFSIITLTKQTGAFMYV